MTREDFYWTTKEDPNIQIRQKILQDPEKWQRLKKLMVPDHTLAFWVLVVGAFQLAIAYIMRNASFSMILIAAYCVGGTCEHILGYAIHELVHNAAFGYGNVFLNEIFGVLASLTLGLPTSTSTKKYHLRHHKYIGHFKEDATLHGEWEARTFTSPFGKFVWLSLQPFFIAFRPIVINPLPLDTPDIVTMAVQGLFNFALAYFVGWKALAYILLSGTGYGIHPMSGRILSEHIMYKRGNETFSYYGPLNKILFNVGYHTEHHAFANIPGRYLPEVKKICPEIFDNQPCHYSWTKVIIDFIFDPNLTLFHQVKRGISERVVADHEE